MPSRDNLADFTLWCGKHITGDEIRLLRRGDHNAARLRMELERWEHQRGREVEASLDAQNEKRKQRLIALIFTKSREETLAGVLGGGAYGQKLASLITKIKFDLPLEDPIKPDQSESNHIKPLEADAGHLSVPWEPPARPGPAGSVPG